jgi:capsular polysaccharide biosynthesis protein
MDKGTQIEEKKEVESNSEFLLHSSDIVEIDLTEKAKALWDERRLILCFIGVFLAIGYFHTEYGPTEYTSTTSLIQESEGSSVGDFGSSFLSSLTGINIPRSGSNNMSAVATGRAPLPASLYPRIITSTEFQKELIYTDFKFSSLDTTINLVEYRSKFAEPSLREKVYDLVGKFTIFLPYTMYDWAKSAWSEVYEGVQSLWSGSESGNSNRTSEISEQDIASNERLQSVTPEERSVMGWLEMKILISSEGGVMDITTTLQDPMAAALINAHLVEYIEEYIKEYRSQKARQNLEATLERFEIVKDRYQEAQRNLAKFRDENINISTQTASLEEERLSNEENLRSTIYNQVAQEVEQARMVLQQQIPVFNVLEKPDVPTSPSSGSSPLLLVISGLLGLFLGIGFVFIRSAYRST